MTKLALIAMAGAAFAIAGCTVPETLHPSFGNSVAQNKAAHIIDPVPADANLPAPDVNGVRAAGGIDRYMKGQVIAPEKISTQGK